MNLNYGIESGQFFFRATREQEVYLNYMQNHNNSRRRGVRSPLNLVASGVVSESS